MIFIFIIYGILKKSFRFTNEKSTNLEMPHSNLQSLEAVQLVSEPVPTSVHSPISQVNLHLCD